MGFVRLMVVAMMAPSALGFVVPSTPRNPSDRRFISDKNLLSKHRAPLCVALYAVPTLHMWKILGDGSVLGIISDHPTLDDGELITTAPLVDPDNADSNVTVRTKNGSRYKLAKPAPQAQGGPMMGLLAAAAVAVGVLFNTLTGPTSADLFTSSSKPTPESGTNVLVMNAPKKELRAERESKAKAENMFKAASREEKRAAPAQRTSMAARKAAMPKKVEKSSMEKMPVQALLAVSGMAVAASLAGPDERSSGDDSVSSEPSPAKTSSPGTGSYLDALSGSKHATRNTPSKVAAATRGSYLDALSTATPAISPVWVSSPSTTSSSSVSKTSHVEASTFASKPAEVSSPSALGGASFADAVTGSTQSPAHNVGPSTASSSSVLKSSSIDSATSAAKQAPATNSASREEKRAAHAQRTSMAARKAALPKPVETTMEEMPVQALLSKIEAIELKPAAVKDLGTNTDKAVPAQTPVIEVPLKAESIAIDKMPAATAKDSRADNDKAVPTETPFIKVPEKAKIIDPSSSKVSTTNADGINLFMSNQNIQIGAALAVSGMAVAASLAGAQERSSGDDYVSLKPSPAKASSPGTGSYLDALSESKQVTRNTPSKVAAATRGSYLDALSTAVPAPSPVWASRPSTTSSSSLSKTSHVEATTFASKPAEVSSTSALVGASFADAVSGSTPSPAHNVGPSTASSSYVLKSSSIGSTTSAAKPAPPTNSVHHAPKKVVTERLTTELELARQYQKHEMRPSGATHEPPAPVLSSKPSTTSSSSVSNGSHLDAASAAAKPGATFAATLVPSPVRSPNPITPSSTSVSKGSYLEPAAKTRPALEIFSPSFSGGSVSEGSYLDRGAVPAIKTTSALFASSSSQVDAAPITKKVLIERLKLELDLARQWQEEIRSSGVAPAPVWSPSPSAPSSNNSVPKPDVTKPNAASPVKIPSTFVGSVHGVSVNGMSAPKEVSVPSKEKLERLKMELELARKWRENEGR